MNNGKLIQHVVNFLLTEYDEQIDIFSTEQNIPDVYKVAQFHNVTIYNNQDENGVFILIKGLNENEVNMIKLIVNYRIKIVDTRKEA